MPKSVVKEDKKRGRVYSGKNKHAEHNAEKTLNLTGNHNKKTTKHISVFADPCKIRMSVDVGGHGADPFYRYKRSRILVKTEKVGSNGQQTFVTNATDIASDIARPVLFITKFFAIELGTHAKYVTIDRCGILLKGIHDVSSLEAILEKFIGLFVLCGSCRLPETKMSIKAHGVALKCAGCGNRTEVSPHKIAKFMYSSTKGSQSHHAEHRKKKKKKKKKSKE